MGKPRRQTRKDGTRRTRAQREAAIAAFVKARNITRMRAPTDRATEEREGWTVSDDLDTIPHSELYAYRLEKPSHGKNRRHGRIRRTEPAGA